MRSLSLAFLVLTMGCSLAFSEDFFDGGKLRIDSASPGVVLEGQQDVVVLVWGANIDQSAELSAELDDPDGVAADTAVELGDDNAVSGDGTMIARTIHLPIMRALAEGEETRLRISIRQSTVVGSELIVSGLDELTFEEVDGCAGNATFVACTWGDEHDLLGLGGLYSEILMPDGLLSLRRVPIALRATSTIVVGASLIGSSCEGGLSGQAGQCLGAGSGTEAAAPNGFGFGGGGAGHLQAGLCGVPSFTMECPGGEGGAPYGSRWGVPLAENLGAGGGGGADSAFFDGYAGGRGGGALSLTAGLIEMTAIVSAVGAAGAPQTPPAACFQGSADPVGGGGGGGSGGTLLLRSLRQPVSIGGEVSASGGSGGLPGIPRCRGGGVGGDGTVRVDSPAIAIELGGRLSQDPVRGPLVSGPRTFESATASLEIAGEVGTEFPLTVNGEQRAPLSLLSSQGLVDVELEPGRNEICLYVPGDVDRSLPESGNCSDVVYLPR